MCQIVITAQILHQYIFCPNKLTVKPGGDLKCLNQPTTSANCTNNGGGDNKSSKSQTFDNAIFRLVSFMASFVSLPFKSVLSVCLHCNILLIFKN